MKRKLLAGLIVVLIVAIGGWLAVNRTGSKSSPKPAPAAHSAKSKKIGDDLINGQGQIFINQGIFGPKELKIKKGTTVVWTNLEAAPHQIIADDASAPGPKSEVLVQGKSYPYTYKSSGTFNYHCALNPTLKGTVTVE